MQICGLQKTTLLDYPGKVAATIFFPGCNFRCPFCHNMNLVEGGPGLPVFEPEEILSFLKKREGILEGVCLTGGEPTLQPELRSFIEKIKKLDYAVKLDTNGSRPEVVKELVGYGLIDYVAMDIKTSIERCSEVSGIPELDTKPIEETMNYLLGNHVGYEFRTTVVREYHNEKVFDEIGEKLIGCNSYYLQSFVLSDHVRDTSLTAYNKEELSGFTKQLKKYDIEAEIRGVE